MVWNETCSLRDLMAATPLLQSPLLLAAGAASELASEDWVATGLSLAVLLLLLVLAVALVGVHRRTRAEVSQRSASRKAVSSGAPGAVSSAAGQRRAIPLYSVTPGQSRYEYNVGDAVGTRGTTLVRAAYY